MPQAAEHWLQLLWHHRPHPADPSVLLMTAEEETQQRDPKHKGKTFPKWNYCWTIIESSQFLLQVSVVFPWGWRDELPTAPGQPVARGFPRPSLHAAAPSVSPLCQEPGHMLHVLEWQPGTDMQVSMNDIEELCHLSSMKVAIISCMKVANLLTPRSLIIIPDQTQNQQICPMQTHRSA